MDYAVLGLKITGFDVSNIGDYIQGWAARQFLPRLDKFIQRERLDEYSGNPTALIMNGWFMHEPEHWPPSPDIRPCFVSFHLNSSAEQQMLTPEGIEYLRKHQPIGCRDKRSADVLKANGVDAYFSGCLTLTLGKSFRKEIHNKKIYFVDPTVNEQSIWSLRARLNYLRLKKETHILAKKWHLKPKEEKHGLLKHYLGIASFLQEYSRFFDMSTLLEAEYITQHSKEICSDYPTDESRMKYARELLEKYSEAGLVVTSRIHCGLPCLGIETPVILTQTPQDKRIVADYGRMGGLEDLFNTLTLQPNGKLIPNFAISGKINAANYPAPLNKWQPLAAKLIETCENFIEATEHSRQESR